jgi:hypothetical protein
MGRTRLEKDDFADAVGKEEEDDGDLLCMSAKPPYLRAEASTLQLYMWIKSVLTEEDRDWKAEGTVLYG